MPVDVTLDPERLADLRERQIFAEGTAQRLIDAGRQLAARGVSFGPRKVFLGDLSDALGVPMTRLAPMVVHLANLGHLELARADLTAAMDPDTVAASAIRLHLRSGTVVESHFLVLPEPPANRIRGGRQWKENPAWLGRALADNLLTMQRAVPAAWLPQIADAHPAGSDVLVQFTELGCGSYGCVLPSHDPQIVIKVTTDASEAAFVERVSQWEWPDGITRYHALMKIEGAYRVSRKMTSPREAWVLWRESARMVGGLEELQKEASGGQRRWGTYGDFATTSESELSDALGLVDAIYAAGDRTLQMVIARATDPASRWREAHEHRDLAAELVDAVDGEPMDGDAWVASLLEMTEANTELDLAAETAIWIEAYRKTAKAMSVSRLMGAVGQTLLTYFERRVFLADLHAGNFGVVDRDGTATWAITDPGNVLFMPERW